MKLRYLIALCTIVLLCQSISAQDSDDKSSYTSKGRILLGTSTSLSFAGLSIKDVDDQILAFSVNLNAGYFVANRLVVGLGLGYDYAKFGDITQSSYDVGVFARYYTKPNIFVGTGYLLTQSEGDEAVGTIPIEVGYAWFLNRTFALEPALFFGIGANNNDTFIYAFNLGLGIYLN